MSDMAQGLSLMIVGMGTVFIFLSLLVFCITVSSKFLNRFWPESPSTHADSITTDSSQVEANDEALVAVITSAVHQYRKKHR